MLLRLKSSATQSFKAENMPPVCFLSSFQFSPFVLEEIAELSLFPSAEEPVQTVAVEWVGDVPLMHQRAASFLIL